MKNKYIYILIILLLAFSPVVSAANWSVSSNTSYNVDFVNSSMARPFMYYLAISNNTAIWEFPTVGFFYSLTLPFTSAFDNYGGPGVFFAIIWFIFLLMVWKNSGKITIPAMVGVMSAGALGMLIPEQMFPTATLLLAASLAALLLQFFAKEE